MGDRKPVPVPPSRNDPCPCGSGLRFKFCHGALQVPPKADAVAELRRAGEAALRAGNVSAARVAWSDVVARVPGDAEGLFYLGSFAREAGAPDEAIRLLRQARDAAPHNVAIMLNLGLALEDAGRLDEAEPVFRAAQRIAPQAFEPLANLAQNLHRRHQYAPALTAFNALVERFDVKHATLWANRGACAFRLHDLATAEASCIRAIALEPEVAGLHADLAVVLLEAKRYEEAAESFKRVIELDPAHPGARADLLHCRLNVADWRDFDVLAGGVLAQAKSGSGSAPVSPFVCQVLTDDPALLREAAEAMAAVRAPGVSDRPRRRPQRSGRLRLGFVSYDLYEHPVGRLIVRLVEQLDAARFEVTLYACGERHADAIARRLAGAAKYVDVGPVDPDALAARIRDDAVDVLFDLAGYTGRGVVEVFARRPAPLQVNFLGYTGTMGSTAYDRIVCDAATVEPADDAYYVEGPLRIDPCYLPSDPLRTDHAPHVARGNYGLPETGSVLAALAPTYKILPEVFGVWMALVRRHDDAVLWLRAMGAVAEARLREAARLQAVDPTRLHFAPTEPTDRYLARMRCADLLLDTAPFGAHTTVNDALCMGLPVVTVRGRSFAARASASQAAAAGLGAFVARDLGDYFSIADALLADRGRLAETAATLRAASPSLFAMEDYARRFAAAVEDAWGAI